METMYDNTKKSKLTNTTKTNYYQVDYSNEVTRLNVEKQQLISFLEDKIKECDDTIKLFLKKNDGSMFNGIEIAHLQDFKRIYQEVLDFVEKGGKE